MAKPFYGVDGNLLAGELPHDHAVVEAILDGRFKPTYWAQHVLCRITSSRSIRSSRMRTLRVLIGAPTTRSWRRGVSAEPLRRLAIMANFSTCWVVVATAEGTTMVAINDSRGVKVKAVWTGGKQLGMLRI
jgi:hypothetical protein